MSAARGNTSRWGALLVAASLVLGACGLGDRAALEDQITSAPGRFEDISVDGTLVVEQRLLQAPDLTGFGGAGGPAFELPEDGITTDTATGTVEVRMGPMQATLTLEGETRPSVLADGDVFYGRRDGVPDDDARPWVRLDLDDVRDDAGELSPFEGNAQLAMTALHPVLLVDLSAGALTGSIETVGAEEINGTPTTHYEINVSIDKALADTRRSRYPEDIRDRMVRLIELLGIDGDVHPAEVWLTDGHDLRRFRIRLQQRPIRGAKAEIVATIEFTAPGTDAPFETPTPQEVLSVDSPVRFARTVAKARDDDEPEIPASIAATLGDVIAVVPGAPTAGSADPPTSDEPAGGTP